MDTLDFAREVWKEFGLNNSDGAGMAYFENGELIKSHGAKTDISRCKEFGEVFTTQPKFTKG